MAPSKFARFERAFNSEPDLLGIEGLAHELINRCGRHGWPSKARLGIERKQANDFGMGDAQIGEKSEPAARASVLGDYEVDMGVGKSPIGVCGGANGKDAVTGLVGQKVNRIGPFRSVVRQDKDSSELIHAMLFVRLNTFLAVTTAWAPLATSSLTTRPCSSTGT